MGAKKSYKEPSDYKKYGAEEPATAYRTAPAPPASIRINRPGKPAQEVSFSVDSGYFFNQRHSGYPSSVALGYFDVLPLIDYLGYNQQDLSQFLDVNASTISRWKSKNTPLGSLRSKNILEVDQVIAKGVRLFGSRTSFKEWLYAINDALGDVRPIDVLKDPYGVKMVDNALEALSWGSYL